MWKSTTERAQNESHGLIHYYRIIHGDINSPKMIYVQLIKEDKQDIIQKNIISSTILVGTKIIKPYIWVEEENKHKMHNQYGTSDHCL